MACGVFSHVPSCQATEATAVLAPRRRAHALHPSAAATLQQWFRRV